MARSTRGSAPDGLRRAPIAGDGAPRALMACVALCARRSRAPGSEPLRTPAMERGDFEQRSSFCACRQRSWPASRGSARHSAGSVAGVGALTRKEPVLHQSCHQARGRRLLRDRTGRLAVLPSSNLLLAIWCNCVQLEVLGQPRCGSLGLSSGFVSPRLMWRALQVVRSRMLSIVLRVVIPPAGSGLARRSTRPRFSTRRRESAPASESRPWAALKSRVRIPRLLAAASASWRPRTCP